MNKLKFTSLFIIALLLFTSCEKEFAPDNSSEDYNNLKEGIAQLISMRSTSHSDKAANLNFDIMSHTTVWTFPDGTLSGTSVSKDFTKPLESFSQAIGFGDVTEAHYWVCGIGKSIQGLKDEFKPKDHLGFLRSVTGQILNELGIDPVLQSEQGYVCYLFFEQSAYIKFKDFAEVDKDGNTKRSLEYNAAAVYAEGSAVHLLAKMIMVLTGIS